MTPPADRHVTTRRLWTTPDGTPLLYYGEPMDVSVVTGTATTKWYSLWFVYPSGTVGSVSFPSDPDFEGGQGPCFVDHAPNPHVVVRWAAFHGYALCELTHEVMVGRWELEVLADRYEVAE